MNTVFNYEKYSLEPARPAPADSKVNVSFQRLSPQEQELIKRDIWDRALAETHRRVMSIHDDLTNLISVLSLPERSGIMPIADRIHALNTDLRCWRGKQ